MGKSGSSWRPVDGARGKGFQDSFPKLLAWNPGSGGAGAHLVQHQGVLFTCSPTPTPARLLREPERTGWGGITSRGCKRARAADAHQRTRQRHGAQTPRSRQLADTHPRHRPAHPTPPHPSRRQVDSVAMKRKPRLSLLQTATRQTFLIVRLP